MKLNKAGSLFVLCAALFALTLASCSSGGGNGSGPVLDSNARLSSLALSVGTLTPPFSSTTMTYTSNVTVSTVSTGVTASAASGKATMTIDGAAVVSGVAHTVDLSVGANPIAIVVLAEDGTSTKTYTITVTRSAVGLSPASVDILSGQTTTLTAVLSSATSTDTVVTLTSSNTDTVTAPSLVTIPTGTNQAAFAVTSVLDSSGTVTITATLNTDSATALVHVLGACFVPADCGTDTECQSRTCITNACGLSNVADGTACTLPNASPTCFSGTCGGNGSLDCTTVYGNCDGDVTNGCEANMASDVNNCGACAYVCASSEVCVAAKCVATCSDGLKDGDETDVDCGGTCPTKCATGKLCQSPADCASGVCAANVCQPLTQGSACSSGDQCGTGNCVDGFCCDTACNSTCMACSMVLSNSANGTCSSIPAGQDPNSECSGKWCNGAGACNP